MPIDYGPFLQSQELNRQALSPAMQNMALMTAMFKDVAVPLMQMSMQRDQLALQQQNAAQGFQLQKDQLAQQLVLGEQNFALRREEMEQRTTLQLKAEEAAALARREDYDYRLKLDDLVSVRQRDLAKTQRELALDEHGWAIDAAEKLTVAEAQKRREDREFQIKIMDTKMAAERLTQIEPLYEAAFIKGDFITAGRHAPEITSLKARISGNGLPITTAPNVVAQTANFLRDPTIRQKMEGDDVSFAHTYNAVKNARFEDLQANNLVMDRARILEQAKTKPVAYFNNKAFPQVSADGNSLTTTLASDPTGKALAMGTTFDNAVKLSKPPFTAEWNKVKTDARKAEKNPQQLAKLEAWFTEVEAGTADFDNWSESGWQAVYDDPYAAATGVSLNGKSGAGASPPGAAAEAAAVKQAGIGYQPGLLRRAVAAGEKVAGTGYSHVVGGVKELFVGGAHARTMAENDEFNARIDKELESPFLRGTEVAEAKSAVGAAAAKYKSAAGVIERHAAKTSMPYFDAIIEAVEGGSKDLKHAAEEIIVNTDWEKYSRQIPDETRLTMRFREAMARIEYFNSRLKQKN